MKNRIHSTIFKIRSDQISGAPKENIPESFNYVKTVFNFMLYGEFYFDIRLEMREHIDEKESNK